MGYFKGFNCTRELSIHNGSEEWPDPDGGTSGASAGHMGMDDRAEMEMEERAGAPTMGRLAKVSYSHLDMIDFMLANPGCTLAQMAARYGYSVGWICNIQASDAFKAAFAARREAIVDPVLHQSINEHFEGITRLSLQRLQEKLEQPAVSDNVVLRAVELGARAMGVGGNAPPPAPTQDHLARLASRLIELQANVRTNLGVTIDGQATEISA